MKIAIGSDHRGYDVATSIAERLRRAGHEIDVIACGEQVCDYPDRAFAVGGMIAGGETERGILICGTGIGMSMAANKIPGIRAALAYDELTAQMARSHNDANVLCLSADLLGLRLIEKIVDSFLVTEFEGGRHARRVEKIGMIEKGQDPQTWRESVSKAG
jgi:ribose 5-phosphate isomerase B